VGGRVGEGGEGERGWGVDRAVGEGAERRENCRREDTELEKGRRA